MNSELFSLFDNHTVNCVDNDFLTCLENTLFQKKISFDSDTLIKYYLPLAKYILSQKSQHPHTTFFIGISGSVSSGKSYFCNILNSVLSLLAPELTSNVISTDGFLYTNKELEDRKILEQKGLPCSYDYQRIDDFLNSITTNNKGQRIEVPLYSHNTYDVCIHSGTFISCPDIIIFEGVNTLQDTTPVSFFKYLQLGIYLHVNEDDLFTWYSNRCHKLVEAAKTDPTSMYRIFLNLTDEELKHEIKRVWDEINHKNLVNYILPSKNNADIIIKLNSNHTIKELVLSSSQHFSK